MPHGALDYTHITQAKMIAASVELDLPLILLDRFDSANFLWDTAGAPADFDAGAEAEAAYEGDAGLAIRTSLAAAFPNDNVIIDRHAFTTPTKKISFSALFRVNNACADTQQIQFIMRGRYDERNYAAGVRYRPNDNDWDWMVNIAAWEEFLTGIEQCPPAWQRVHFEIDLENMQYIAFETADRRINLQGTPINSNALAGNELLQIYIFIENRVIGSRADISIDNIIVKELGS